MVEDPLEEADILELVTRLDHNEVVLVVETDGEIVGWGHLRPYSSRWGYRFAGETSLFLRRTHLGRGLGTMLQRALVDAAISVNYHHLVARIFADNRASIGLHEKVGYYMVGVQREIGFKKGDWQDIAIMGLVLTPLDDR